MDDVIDSIIRQCIALKKTCADGKELGTGGFNILACISEYALEGKLLDLILQASYNFVVDLYVSLEYKPPVYNSNLMFGWEFIKTTINVNLQLQDAGITGKFK